jgi:hypothetical protein
LTKRYSRRMQLVARPPAVAGKMKELALAVAVLAAILMLTLSVLPMIFSLLALVAVFLVHLSLERSPPLEEGEVEVSEAGVRIDGDLVPTSRIADAFWVPRLESGGAVRLLDEVGATIFEANVDDEADARAFIAALGRDVSRQRVAFEADTPLGLAMRHRPFAALAALVALVAAVKVAGAIWTVVFAALAVNYLVMTIAPTARVVVGSDGVQVSWLRYRRFVPYADVAGIEPIDHGVRFALRSGASREIRFRSSTDTDVEALVRRDALIARVREAMEGGAHGTSRQELLGRLARANRPVDRWVRELATLRGDTQDYRSAAVRDDDLLDVVEDATAPPDARAAAAVVLRKTAGPDVRAKLRVVADAIAEPRLRVAIETAAADDDEAVDAALGDLAERP